MIYVGVFFRILFSCSRRTSCRYMVFNPDVKRFLRDDHIITRLSSTISVVILHRERGRTRVEIVLINALHPGTRTSSRRRVPLRGKTAKNRAVLLHPSGAWQLRIRPTRRLPETATTIFYRRRYARTPNQSRKWHGVCARKRRVNPFENISRFMSRTRYSSPNVS